MSEQNRKTLKVYDRLAQKYLENTHLYNQANPEKAKQKKAKLEAFLLKSFKKMADGGRILEIGSGDGVNAYFLKKSGFRVIASDISDAFLASCRINGLEPIKLDAIKDNLPVKLSGVLAWRTFVHFTKEDLEVTFQKIYSALDPNGIFVFNLLNMDSSHTDKQWLDLSGQYKMGEKRFFAYYTEQYIKELIDKIGFSVDTSFKQGGENGKKWLCYVLKK